MDAYLKDWKEATADLPWGVQHVMYETLKAVADGQVKLVHGADYSNGSPCLVNAVASMTEAGGGKGIPISHFNNLVRAFDQVNNELWKQGHNEQNLVSPLAAEILLRNFAPLKDKPIATAVEEVLDPIAFETGTYRESSDEDLTRDWLNAMQEGAVCDLEEVLSHKPVEGPNYKAHIN